MELRKVSCLGAGFAGGPTMAVLAQKNPQVQVVVLDVDAKKIRGWNSEELPMYEPGLNSIVSSCRGSNLSFSTDMSHLRDSDVIFIAVNTPTKKKGLGAGEACDLSSFEKAARSIASNLKGVTSKKIIVEKSTVPVRTAEKLHEIISLNCPGLPFAVVSNPEFLAEGTAIKDLVDPDRVLIGGSDEEAIELFKGLFSWLPAERLLTTSVWSSELAKLCNNAMAAQRISSINSISAICEKVGADVDEVSSVLAKDQRTGSKFLKTSLAFGGNCLGKDTLCLVYICESLGLYQVADYWRQVIIMNNWQRSRFCLGIFNALMNNVAEKHICIFGFAYKSQTSDTRESPAIYVAKSLIDEHAILHIYDPKATRENILLEMNEHGFLDCVSAGKHMITHSCPYEAAANTSAVVLITEWPEFRDLDYQRLYDSMNKPAYLFDGRNVLNHQELSEIGFTVSALGKSEFCLNN